MNLLSARPVANSDAGEASSDNPSAAFVDLYVAHYPRLVRALVLAGADPPVAEDTAQEAFARALAGWTRVSRGDNPAGYVYVTGFRLLRRQWRRSASRSLRPDRDRESSTGDSTAVVAVARADLETALAGMPPRRRACTLMCLMAGLSPAEAGRALGIAPGTVRKHLEEARRTLTAV